MTVEEMLELLPVLIRMHRGGLVEISSIHIERDEDWVGVEFANGRRLALTVEEL
jgi:hypothetical protein